MRTRQIEGLEDRLSAINSTCVELRSMLEDLARDARHLKAELTELRRAQEPRESSAAIGEGDAW